MCGIAGEIRFDGCVPEVKTLQRICNAMENRGPDNSGILQHGPIALGHRRLKIFDLSEHGQQPMYDPHLGLAAVFNGAIYNFPELLLSVAYSSQIMFKNYWLHLKTIKPR